MQIWAPTDRENRYMGIEFRQTFLRKIQLHIQKRNYIRVVPS